MLTDNQIDAVTVAQWGGVRLPLAAHRAYARAIEAEVRGQDDALIRQLVEALEQSHATLWEEDDDPARPVHAAIAAARARLENKP